MKNYILYLLLISFNTLLSQEICDNGIGDDNDGLIDLNDTIDCQCTKFKDSLPISLIPNPSFENKKCCPQNISEFKCLKEWSQASKATTDYYNSCGITKLPLRTYLPPPPLKFGNGYIGSYNKNNWKEYAGIFLNDTLYAGVQYKIQFYMAYSHGNTNLEVGIFGSQDSNHLPFNSKDCPTNDPNWVSLKSKVILLKTSTWNKIELNFTPTKNITTIALGPGCKTVKGSNYYYYDHLTLNKASLFPPFITSIGNHCKGKLILKIHYPRKPNSIQWFKDGVALINNTSQEYSVPLNIFGKYRVKLVYDSICNITKEFDVRKTNFKIDYYSFGSCNKNKPAGRFVIKDVIGGYVPYQFKLDSNPYVKTVGFIDLKPKKYTLLIKDDKLCVFKKEIIIIEYPKSKSIFNADTVCLGSETTFKNNSKNTVAYRWDFGNGLKSEDKNPTHKFTNSGSFNVKLLVYSEHGCSDSSIMDIKVKKYPILKYAINKEICWNNKLINLKKLLNTSPNYVKFKIINNSIFPPTLISTSKGEQYINIGRISNSYHNIKLKLIANNGFNGCADSTETKLIINPSPVSKIHIDTVCLNDSTSFINFSKNTLKYKWFLGNSDSNKLKHFKYKYKSAKQYTIKLISENLKCSDTAYYKAIVNTPPKMGIKKNVDICWGNTPINLHLKTNSVSKLYTFKTNYKKTLFPKLIKKTNNIYFIDIGILNNKTHKIPLYITLSDSFTNCQSTDSIYFTIYQKLNADFTSYKHCTNDSVLFTNNSTKNVLYKWIFNNKDSSKLINPTYQFKTPGKSSIKLITYLPLSCSDTSNKTIIIHQSPKLIFNKIEDICWFDGSINLHIKSKISPIYSRFKIRNSNGLIKSNKVNDYLLINNLQNKKQSININIVAENPQSFCKDSGFITVNVFPKPISDFEVIPGLGVTKANALVKLKNKSFISSGIIINKWDFGTLNTKDTSNLTNPSFDYSKYDTGFYNILLITKTFPTSKLSCFDISSKKLYLAPDVSVFIPNAFSPNNRGIEKNNKFNLVVQNAKSIKFSIYNRWGEMVFNSTTTTNIWDGNYKNSKCEQGIYIYTLAVVAFDNSLYNYSGTIHLIR